MKPSLIYKQVSNIVSIVGFLVILLVTTRLWVQRGAVSSGVIEPQQNKVDIFFSPTGATLPPDTTFKLILDAKSYRVAFVRIELTFDPSKVNLTNVIQVTNLLGSAGVTGKDQANVTGHIVMVLTLLPENRDSPPSGVFELAQLSFGAVTTEVNRTTNLTVIDQGVQIVDIQANLLPFTSQQATLTINPDLTTQHRLYLPLVVSGNHGVPPTLTPTSTSTSTPTRAPTPTKTPTPTSVPSPVIELDVSAPSTMSVVNGQYQPFDVVITVKNTGTATAHNLDLSMLIPDDLGADTSAGSIGDLAPGQQHQVTWSVYAALSAPTTGITLTYSVTVQGSNIDPISVEKQIILPPIGCVDQFDTSSLNAAWTWTDPLGDSSFSLTANPGYLRLSTPDGEHDLYQNLNAPRILRSISGNFVATTKVAITPQYNYQGAGLLLWQDENNYLRLERTLVKGIDFGGKIGGSFPTSTEIPFSTSPVYLRFQRSGNSVTASYSENGYDWTTVNTMTFTISNTLQVGLDLINQWQDNPISADFDFFQLNHC